MNAIIEYFSRVFRNVKTTFNAIAQTVINICHALGPDKELRQKGRQALKETCIQFVKNEKQGAKEALARVKQGWYNLIGKK